MHTTVKTPEGTAVHSIIFAIERGNKRTRTARIPAWYAADKIYAELMRLTRLAEAAGIDITRVTYTYTDPGNYRGNVVVQSVTVGWRDDGTLRVYSDFGRRSEAGGGGYGTIRTIGTWIQHTGRDFLNTFLVEHGFHCSTLLHDNKLAYIF